MPADRSLATTASFADFVALGKPRITFMLLLTTFGGMWLSPMPLTLGLSVIALLGIALVFYGANALNMYLETDVDGLMSRTQNRPLPAGRMAPDTALRAGIAASVAAVALLTFAVNPLTGLLAAVSLAVYVLFYTPFKRRSTLALLVGAIPGAAPPLLGWTAVTNRVDSGALCLFFIMFVWQLPHFLAISVFRRDEYMRAGLKVVPGVRGMLATKLRIVLYSALFGVATLPAYTTGMASRGYLVVALVSGLGFFAMALSGLSKRSGTTDEIQAADARWSRRLFGVTLLHLPLLFGALAMFRR